MDEKRGAFIVIEGSDGSGKATQLKLVKDRLEAAGYQVETFDFPRYDKPSSYFVKRYLEGSYGQADEVGPYTSSLFYALDRFEAAPDIRRALKDGKIVVSNRYSGSNMAHQGTKIANAEQRRGFFIWLDNLEFEMLRIPRPDISFVLRVPAEISQKLMADREKTDIHEADLTHLQRALAVYDDMTQLFPKDFQRIDCVRSGQLLDPETINTMLWEKITPLLPPPPTTEKPSTKQEQKQPIQAAITVPTKTQEDEEVKKQEEVKKDGPIGVEPVIERRLTIEAASGLLVQKIERTAKTARLEQPDIPVIFAPANLIPEAEKEYQAKTSALLGLYAKLVAGLAKHGIAAPEARRAAHYALPVAATSSISIDADDPNLEELIINLINDELPEAQTAGASLFAQAVKISPNRFKDAETPVQKTAPTAVKTLADEFLSENHIGEQPTVQLTSVWPRNETELAADMLYEYSSLPLRTIQDRITNWPMSRKLAVLEAYVSDTRPGSVLEKASYSWDLLSPYDTFLELQCHPASALEIQLLTPRYGFDVPKLIEEADLSDTFEKCFDLSLELYSTMQKAGHHLEAQYATLQGHNQRWKMTQNASQIIDLLQIKTDDPATKSLLKKVRESLAEVHPTISEILAEATTFTDS